MINSPQEQLSELFLAAADHLKQTGVIPAEYAVEVKFERTRQKEHGDFATNLAMVLAKPARRSPREVAELIVAALPENTQVVKTDIAGPGFINVFLAADAKYQVLSNVFALGDQYGRAAPDSKQKIMIEFVSANPTGPLHVGHGRGAVYGDSLGRLLTAAGHTVEREYYVNDAGRQMDILAASVWVRYAQAAGSHVTLPAKAYQGGYVQDMGSDLYQQHQKLYLIDADQIEAAQQDLEDEAALDALILTLKTELGRDGFEVFFKRALDTILADIKDDLSGFGIDYDTWFSERSLFTSGKIDRAIATLKESGALYEKKGAWWFKSSDYGDEKDRVVVRENGQPTYFASDIAYHFDKLERGFDLAINIWGSDHHGYIPRVTAAMQAMGLNPEQLKVLLVQFAVLYRSGEKISMSTRSGMYVTLRELREEIGSDAARFFYTQRKSEQHMDFDLDLAKSQSNENPMYYVQYAHARISRIFSTAVERKLQIAAPTQANYALLNSDQEDTLLKLIERFPELIENAASQYEPHQVTYFLRDLATAFHSWYNSSRFLELPDPERDAKLALCSAVQQVLRNGLDIIGVAAPESM